MAVITENTFNPLLRYVGVRLQQGVPIVDADVNEREDARQFEVRAFLKWFVGNGVPEGNDGFRIEGTGLANDFFIRAGAPKPLAGTTPTNVEKGLSYVGRCLVDGLDVLITDDVKCSALVVPPVLPLSTPTADSTVLVYLDVWTRLVTPTEEPKLIHPTLGTESCARYKREWAVRVRTPPADTSNAPDPDDGDYVSGHSYYALASIARRKGDPVVNAADVKDLREKRLLTPPATLITDTLGLSAQDYRRGLGRPRVSLRAAINALLRGELLASPDIPLSPSTGIEQFSEAFLVDNSNGLLAFYFSTRSGATWQLYGSRLDLNNFEAGFVELPAPITTGNVSAYPSALVLPGGEIFLAYMSIPTGGTAFDIFFKRANYKDLAAAPPQQATATGTISEYYPRIFLSGDYVLFLMWEAVKSHWQYRRYNYKTNAWAETSGPVDLPYPVTEYTLQAAAHAAREDSGKVWIAYAVGPQAETTRVFRFNPANATVDLDFTLESGTGADWEAFIVPMPGNGAYVFWRGPQSLRYIRYFNDGTSTQQKEVPYTTHQNDRTAKAVRDGDDIYLFFQHEQQATSIDIFFTRLNTLDDTWSQEQRALTTGYNADVAPFPMMAPDHNLFIFWLGYRAGNPDIFYKRIITAI